MANIDIIHAFINHKRAKTALRDIPYNGYYIAKGRSLESTGDKLYSYDTVIARWSGDKVELNTKKYSSSTSRVQSALAGALARAGIATIEMA